MTTYRIEDEILEANDPALSDALGSVYASKIRPICLCRNEGVEMYVAKVAGHFILKRMPNTGGSHCPSCDSYEPPPELSGLGQVMGTAIQENTDDGQTTLKLNFSLTKMGGRSSPSPSGAEKDSVKTDGTKLTLRGTLHYLWGESGLNKWTKNMTGKRSWYVVRKYLLQAAENKIAKGANLFDMLYIPETFSVAKKDEITQRRIGQIMKFSAQVKEVRHLMLVIGEVKEFAPSRYGFKIKFKHLPDCDFMMNADIHKRLFKRFESDIELWDAVDDSHLIAIGTATVGTTGIPSLEEIALMTVNREWLPIESTFDQIVLESLISSGRRFTKGLRYNLASTTPLACAVVADTHPNPTGMYILPFGASEEYGKSLATLMEESKLAPWLWKAGQLDMPALPAIFSQ